MAKVVLISGDTIDEKSVQTHRDFIVKVVGKKDGIIHLSKLREHVAVNAALPVETVLFCTQHNVPRGNADFKLVLKAMVYGLEVFEPICTEPIALGAFTLKQAVAQSMFHALLVVNKSKRAESFDAYRSRKPTGYPSVWKVYDRTKFIAFANAYLSVSGELLNPFRHKAIRISIK